MINAPLFGTAWRVLILRIEKVWMAAASILNNHSRTADSRWASSLYVERANCSLQEMGQRSLDLDLLFGAT